MNEWKLGDYCMQRGTPVRLSQHFDSGRFGVTYVQIIEHDEGIRVINGGGSFSWGPEDFQPITDPYLLAATNAFEAERSEAEHKKAAHQSAEDRKKWMGVMEVLRATKFPSGKESKP